MNEPTRLMSWEDAYGKTLVDVKTEAGASSDYTFLWFADGSYLVVGYERDYGGEVDVMVDVDKLTDWALADGGVIDGEEFSRRKAKHDRGVTASIESREKKKLLELLGKYGNISADITFGGGG